MSALAKYGTVELALAEELVDGLGPESVETREDRDQILVRLRKRGWKLTQIIFSKASLRRLAADNQREIKLEYLERDIARLAPCRARYAYPRKIGC